MNKTGHFDGDELFLGVAVLVLLALTIMAFGFFMYRGHTSPYSLDYGHEALATEIHELRKDVWSMQTEVAGGKAKQ